MNTRGRPILVRRTPSRPRTGPGDRLEAVVVTVSDREIEVQLEDGVRGLVDPGEVNPKPREGDRIALTYLMRDSRHDEVILTPREPLEKVDWQTLQPGDLVRGRITSLSRDGIAVNVEGTRAFLPAAQLGRGGDGLPPEFGGRSLAADVVSVNPKKKEIRLGLRDRLRHRDRVRRAGILEDLREGQLIRGTIVRLNEYGAFIDLGGVDGLLHESKIQRYCEETTNPLELRTGTELELLVISIDPDRGRVGLAFPLEESERRARDAYSEFEVDEQVTGLIQDVSADGCRVLIDESTTSWLPAEYFPKADVDIQRGQLLTARIADIRSQSPRIQLKL